MFRLSREFKCLIQPQRSDYSLWRQRLVYMCSQVDGNNLKEKDDSFLVIERGDDYTEYYLEFLMN